MGAHQVLQLAGSIRGELQVDVKLAAAQLPPRLPAQLELQGTILSATCSMVSAGYEGVHASIANHVPGLDGNPEGM